MRQSPGWMVAILLLAAIFTVPQLNADGFSPDELRSVIVAGGAHHGPLAFPVEVWARVAEQSPDQALGFSLVIWLWGALTGWSEFATRTLPFLMGLLTIAMTYRIGRDLFSPATGLNAAAILATSIYFITFMHKFRVFTLAALALSVTWWCYWRLIRADRPAGWLAHVGFTLGGIILMYAHYFVTPFLGVLGVYHLLFAPKNRRWWIPGLLIIPVILLFLPELAVLRDGFAMNQTRTDLQDTALSPVGIVLLVAHFFGNGFGWLLIPPLLSAVFILRNPSHRREWVFVWFITLGMIIMLMLVNGASGVFVERRVRYMAGMWVPLALLVGAGIDSIAPQIARSAKNQTLMIRPILILTWCLIGAIVTWQNTLMTFDIGDQMAVLPWRDYANVVQKNWEHGDALIFFGDDVPQHGHYTHAIERRTIVPPYWGADIMREGIVDAQRVWWGINLRDQQDQNLQIFSSMLDDMGYGLCDSFYEHPLLSLTLYASSPAFCPGGSPIVTFAPYLTLMQVEQIQDDNRLIFNTGWQIAPDMPLNAYSIGFHVLNADNDKPVTQTDIGLADADGPYLPLHAEIDLTGLEPDTVYQVVLLVYEWETGNRIGDIFDLAVISP